MRWAAATRSARALHQPDRRPPSAAGTRPAASAGLPPPARSCRGRRPARRRAGRPGRAGRRRRGRAARARAVLPTSGIVHGAGRYRRSQVSRASASSTSTSSKIVSSRSTTFPSLPDEHQARLEGEAELVDGRRLRVEVLRRVGVHLGVQEVDVRVVIGDRQEHVEHRTADRELAEGGGRDEEREGTARLQRVRHRHVVQGAHRVVRADGVHAAGVVDEWASRWRAARPRPG